MADFFVPSPLSSVSVRPLTGGIIRNRAAHQLKAGEFYDLVNVMVIPDGLYRRPGLETFYENHDSFESPTRDLNTDPIDFVTLWKQTGEGRDSIILTPECALLGGASKAVSRMVWLYETATATVSGSTNVTGSGTTWKSDLIQSGDFIRFQSAGYYTQWVRISGVGSDTSISLSEDPTLYDGDAWNSADEVGPLGNGTFSYELARSFSQSEPYLLDWIVTSDPNVGYNELVVASAARPLAVYNENQERFDDFITDDSDTYDYGDSGPGGGTFFASCVAAFMERLWVGHTVEYNSSGVLTDEGDMRHRIRWSSVTDKRDFSGNNYIDLEYMAGDLIRLVPLGNTLVAYANDAVYIGTPTSRVDMPLSFQQVDMGGQGLVGQKAIVPWLNGHFFVGQDDIYFLSMQGPQRIGSPVVRATLRRARNELWRTYVTVDPVHKQILFGFATEEGGGLIEKVWMYNYETKAWSSHVFPGGTHRMIANPVADKLGIAWDDSSMSAVTWDSGLTGIAATWDSFKASEEVRSVYIENWGGTYRLTTANAQDAAPSGYDNIPVTIETGDFDGGAPDRNKIFTRLAIKTEDVDGFRSSAVRFSVQGSVNGGRSWKQLGTVELPSDKDEGYCNFRLSGSMVRFRITSTSSVGPYIVSGLTMRVRASGAEFSLGTTDL